MNYKQHAERLSLVRDQHTLVVGVDIAKRKHWAFFVDGIRLVAGSPSTIPKMVDGFHSLVGHQIRNAAERSCGHVSTVYTRKLAANASATLRSLRRLTWRPRARSTQSSPADRPRVMTPGNQDTLGDYSIVGLINHLCGRRVRWA